MGPTAHSAERKFGSCSCCVHPDCASLKEHQLCRQWHFLQWEATSSAMPLDMLRELRCQLGAREFTMQPIILRGVALEALMKVEPGSGASSILDSFLLPFTESSFFNSRNSRAWSLPCCWDAVIWTVPHWLAFSRTGDDNVILGQTSLGRLLLDEVREAAQGGRCAAAK